MRMKEDHMLNGQLKPGYNVQIGTENQFVVGFSLHQKPGDTTCLIPHLEHLRKLLGRLPKNIIADAGYGSEENYQYLDDHKLGNYVKYNTFDLQQKRSFKKKAFRVENWTYDSEKDEFICTGGQRLRYIYTRREQTENGYHTERRIYEAENCSICPHKSECTRAKRNRRIQISFPLEKFRKQALENLCSKQGLKLRAQRMIEAESVFGRIKSNWSFRRFLLRGLEKVKIEWGLLCIAHNMAKLSVC